MNIENIGEYTLNNLDQINILMGKNGCGKSTLLREVEKELRKEDEHGNIVYISPERGGSLKYNSAVAQNSVDNPNWIARRNRCNTSSQFKEQTFFRFSKLETSTFRKQQKEGNTADFTQELNKINKLLDNISIVQHEQAFKAINKDGADIEMDNISSGEAELISLVIECLVYSIENEDKKKNLLFLDEPDVHMHPDLQVKFMEFLQSIANDNSNIIIATHSTAILGAFEDYNNASVCFMQNRQKNIKFENITDAYQKILPIFGAHPLSNIFIQRPILIVEGEDDVRVWQQAIRSSDDNIKLYPCAAGDIQSLNELENDAKNIIDAVYDAAVGYSLRDRDNEEEGIDDLEPIIRFRTACRNVENLILSNEVLESCSIGWSEFKETIVEWLADNRNKNHPKFDDMNKFGEESFDRKNAQLKEIRNILIYLLKSNKPWEVLVGQAIAGNIENVNNSLEDDDGIFNYLGEKITKEIFIKKET